ncbi:hypothetical protein [Desulfobacula phenolica]|uniref:Fluoride ion transporter CrcB n=1 Tax=Desulfobacula phenolica TaxID=90732 RepID=A0A1H2E499_9BACT|nr:hypothetical protein [Desulfobacula phenolica]SDT89880.1 hypothetical protein SAMN04487931_102484 [Desulfobacula phenolica]
MTVSALKSIFTGVGGTLVLAVFCSTFMPMDKLFFILPLLIAFNGAMSGYRLVEVLKNKIFSIPVFSFVLGVGGGAATFAIINFTGSMVQDVFSLNMYDLLIYMAVSGITSYLGAKLAVRYFNL